MRRSLMMKFKFIELEQGTPEWLAWRKTVITATDASILMGNNPWDTPYKVWQRKLGLAEEKVSNDAMERGKRLEPEARAQFNERYGILMEPAIVESTEYEFLGASLDGMCPINNSLLEIKCGGAKLHAMAAQGEIPQYYRDQMQHQLIVTGAERCYYYSYDGADGIRIEVLPDPGFKESFIPKAREFWRCVAMEEAPPLEDKDYRDMSDDVSWSAIACDYRAICEQIKVLEQKKEGYRQGLLKLSGDVPCLGKGIRLMKTTMKGRVDYDAIPEIQGIDLDKYRKASTTLWKVLVA
jgi:putative phage-type endonuclease